MTLYLTSVYKCLLGAKRSKFQKVNYRFFKENQVTAYFLCRLIQTLLYSAPTAHAFFRWTWKKSIIEITTYQGARVCLQVKTRFLASTPHKVTGSACRLALSPCFKSPSFSNVTQRLNNANSKVSWTFKSTFQSIPYIMPSEYLAMPTRKLVHNQCSLAPTCAKLS